MQRISIPVAGVLLAAACQVAVPPESPDAAPAARLQEDGIVLTTEQDRYERGQPVRLMLDNRTDQALGVNLCLSSLERREGEDWVAVGLFTDDVCPSLLQLLGSGESASHEFVFRADVGPGEYRFRTRIEHMDDGTDEMLPSSPFRLAG